QQHQPDFANQLQHAGERPVIRVTDLRLVTVTIVNDGYLIANSIRHPCFPLLAAGCDAVEDGQRRLRADDSRIKLWRRKYSAAGAASNPDCATSSTPADRQATGKCPARPAPDCAPAGPVGACLPGPSLADSDHG